MRTYPTLYLVISLLLLGLLAGRPALAQEPAGAGEDTVQVVIALEAPPPSPDVPAQADQVEALQAEVLAEVPPAEIDVVQEFEVLPGLVAEVTETGLAELLDQPGVAAVALDLPVSAALVESARFIHADAVWQDYGLTGAGVNVAVLDTGIDPTHPDLADNLVAQTCISGGDCPPNDTDRGDSALDENGHGTHVAGIITSRGTAGGPGIAPDAGIVAVRVLNAAGGGRTSDVLAGLDWVMAHPELNVKLINLSLGGGSYSDTCDSADANTLLYAAAVESARQAGITVFAAAGNNGQVGRLMAPACVAGVVAVGNVYDTAEPSFAWPTCTDTNVQPDTVPCSSNVSPALDLLAPGVTIVAPAPGGGQATRSGTSMSTPHAAAVAALLLQARPDLAPDDLLALLRDSGVPVTDPRPSPIQVVPRVDALAAVSRIASPIPAAILGRVTLPGRTNQAGASVYVSEGDCPLVPAGSPAAVTDSDGRFSLTAPPALPSVGAGAYRCLLVVQPGYLSGQKAVPQGDLGAITLPGGDVTGDGLIDIFDLAFMAGRYGGSDPAADITANGLVDIFDLSIAAGNYGRRGPVEAWE